MAFKGINAKESTHVQAKSEIHACALLGFHEYCSQRVGSRWTANQYYYTDILERQRKRVMRFRPNNGKNWILHHVNAPAHAAFSVAQFFISKWITVMPQPPYSPDFFLFQKVKSTVKGHNFKLAEDIQRAVTQAFNDIPQVAFQECYKR